MGRLPGSQTQPSHDVSEVMDASQASSIDQTIIVNAGIITFTRCLMLNRSMTEEEVTAVYLQIFPDDPQACNFRNVLKEINDSLQKSKIKIVSSKCELTGQKYYLVIPTYFKPTQIWPNNVFKELELNFIKTVISEVILSDVGLVTRERVVRKHEFISSDEAKRILNKLVEQDYLIEPRDGKYTLSVLAMCELEPYFHFTFRDSLKKCVFCKRIMFFGGICESCKCTGHFSCITKFKESMKNKPFKCPSCNEEWSQDEGDGIEHVLDYYGDEDTVETESD